MTGREREREREREGWGGGECESLNKTTKVNSSQSGRIVTLHGGEFRSQGVVDFNVEEPAGELTWEYHVIPILLGREFDERHDPAVAINKHKPTQVHLEAWVGGINHPRCLCVVLGSQLTQTLRVAVLCGKVVSSLEFSHFSW